jgi:hypothetical protein
MIIGYGNRLLSSRIKRLSMRTSPGHWPTSKFDLIFATESVSGVGQGPTKVLRRAESEFWFSIEGWPHMVRFHWHIADPCPAVYSPTIVPVGHVRIASADDDQTQVDVQSPPSFPRL